MKILLSITNIEYLDYLKELLTKAFSNDNFCTALSWEQTHSAVENEEPDMVIIDVDFSDCNLSSAMSYLSSMKNIYTLLIINTEDPEEIEQFFKMNGNDYIDRSSCDADFIARVKIALKTRETIQKLHSAENSFSILTNLISDCDCLLSKGKIFYMSPSCERITGYSQNEFIKNPGLLRSIVHEEDQERVFNQPKDLPQDDELYYYEFRIITRSGRKRWLSSISQPVHDNNGNILYWRVANRDLTEQRVLEEAWQMEKIERESEKKYREIAEMLPEIVFETDEKYNLKFVNEAAFSIFGYSQEDLENGLNILNLLSPQDHERARTNIRKVMTGKIIGSNEYTAQKKDGSTFPIIVQSTPVIRNNKPTGIRGIGVNITERKEIEVALNHSNSLLKAQQEASLDGILVVNNNRETTSFNKQLCNIWKITEKELLNVNSGKRLNYISEKVKTPSPEKFIEEIEEIYNEPLKKIFDEILLEDGRVIERYSGPIISQGSYYGRVWFFRDITERKQKEVELEAAYNKINEGIRNARRFHEGSLPKSLPQIENIAIAAYYNPAEELGGDYYNIIKIGDQLLFYITDVAGHGLDSAMLTVFIKEAINGFLSFEHKKERTLSPKAILKYLASQYYREGFPEFYYICAFVGVLDLKSYKLRYCSVGFHSPSFAINESGQVFPLTIQCLPISTVIGLELMNFKEKRITLFPGTTIFLTTDGLVEQMIGNTQYMERLQEIIQKNSFLPPELLVNVINEDYESFSGTLQGDDDITFIAAQVTQKPKDRLTLKTESYIYAIDSVLDRLQTFFQKYIEDVDYFLMGVNELVNNAIEHGNNFEPEKNVIIDAVVTTKYVSVTIEDEGDGFNWQDKVKVPFNIFNTNTRSRGVILTKMCFCDHLHYNEQGNRVTLLKKL